MSDITVQVSFHAETKKSFGVLVDLIFDQNGNNTSAARLEWFPYSICKLEKKEVPGKRAQYFLTAPEWILKEKNII